MSDADAKRLLIVDDEVRQMQALCETLREHGYTTIGAATAEAAMEALRAGRFDLILTDLMLPGTNGIELLRSASAIDPDLVGIIMTGQGSIASAVEAMKEGALDYILKPFKVSVVLPVISRALAMRQLRLDNAALQRRIRERTRELEEANESLDAFAGSIAHDLHAPARHVAAYAEMVLSEYAAELSPEVQRHLRVIANAGERMGKLIADVLVFSRVGRAELHRDPVDLTALANRVWNELAVLREVFERPEEKRNLELRVATLPTVKGDEAMLRQVFYNLLSNALKYTRGRDPVRIEVGGQREENGTVTVYVRDNGVGFEMEHVGKLFGLFQRLHSTRDFEGNGVGLANVQRIVKRHGGRVWAEGEVGRGATFYFQLPADARQDGGTEGQKH